MPESYRSKRNRQAQNKLSPELIEFWEDQINNPKSPIKAAAQSGRCMFCNKPITADDTDHSVCNDCWKQKIGEEE